MGGRIDAIKRGVPVRRLSQMLSVVLVASLASFNVGAQSYKSYQETQALTRAAPTAATEGASLAGATGYRVTVSAPSGQTITGGSILCYTYNPTLKRWARCKSAFDITLLTGVRDSPSEEFKVAVGGGRVLFATDSVTLSGGTTVVVTIDVK